MALSTLFVPSVERALATLEAAVADLLGVVRTMEPSSISGDAARAMVDLFAQGERAAASGIALFSPRVLETGSHAKVGHGSAADWLGAVAGSSMAVAKDRLAAARRASTDAALTKALHQGELSAAQLQLLGDAEAAAPGSAKTLLDLAGTGASHQELRDTATRPRAAAADIQGEAARRARVHERRHFRWRQCPEGGVRGEFLCDEVAWARIAPRLEAGAKARWKAAGSSDGASLETHRLDAFVDFMGGGCREDVAADAAEGTEQGAEQGAAHRSRVETVVIIDAEALRRGTTQGDELCEIEGIGPVSLAAASELLGEGSLRFVIKEGFDIKTVTRPTGASPRPSRPPCSSATAPVVSRAVASGSGSNETMSSSTTTLGGPSELDNLVRLCPGCHALKTFSGWRLEGTPGNFTWIAPAHPKSAGAISRARKLAAAKAGPPGATKDRNRNRPRRT